MSEVKTTPAKYIFLDVVGFTNNRSVEAQADIVGYLNSLVSERLRQRRVPEDKRILLPTGDGICIALLNIEDPYDIHVQIGLDILAALHKHNSNTELDESRKFEVRIGISANTDNLVTDINGRQNIAGAGINIAQRVMDKADGGQILVSQTVYETLKQREKYMNLLQGYRATTKHGESVDVYQLLMDGNEGVNVETPSAFQSKETERKLPTLVAHYLAHAAVHRDIFLKKKATVNQYAAIVLLYLQSLDSMQRAVSSEVDEPFFHAYGEGKVPFSEQLEFYSKQDFWTLVQLSNFVTRDHLKDFQRCFERSVHGITDYRFVSSNGRSKLYSDCPEVWDSFGLSTEETDVEQGLPT